MENLPEQQNIFDSARPNLPSQGLKRKTGDQNDVAKKPRLMEETTGANSDVIESRKTFRTWLNLLNSTGNLSLIFKFKNIYICNFI